MALCVVDAASPVTIEAMPIYFSPGEVGWVKKGLQRSRIGEIGAAHIADLLVLGNRPIQRLTGTIKQIQISIVEQRGFRRVAKFKLRSIYCREFFNASAL